MIIESLDDIDMHAWTFRSVVHNGMRKMVKLCMRPSAHSLFVCNNQQVFFFALC